MHSTRCKLIHSCIIKMVQSDKLKSKANNITCYRTCFWDFYLSVFLWDKYIKSHSGLWAQILEIILLGLNSVLPLVSSRTLGKQLNSLHASVSSCVKYAEQHHFKELWKSQIMYIKYLAKYLQVRSMK